MTGCKQQLHVDYIPTDRDAPDVTNTIILTTALRREAQFFKLNKLSELCSTVCLVAFAMYLALIAGLAVLHIAACASSKLS